MLVELDSSDLKEIWPKGFVKVQRENILLAHGHILALFKKKVLLFFDILFSLPLALSQCHPFSV